MNLLVTRPEPDAERTASRLRALGHSVIVQPLLTITVSPPPAGLPEPSALLVTSQNGVRSLATWPQAHRWSGVPLFAAGKMTGRAAIDAGFSDVRDGAFDGESLIQSVMTSVPPGSGPLVYPAARDRAGPLAEHLGALGYDVRVIEAYRAQQVSSFAPGVCEALAQGRIDGVLLYSRRTAAAFLFLVDQAGLRDAVGAATVYALSEAVAAEASALGCTVAVAETPDEDSLFFLLSPRA